MELTFANTDSFMERLFCSFDWDTWLRLLVCLCEGRDCWGSGPSASQICVVRMEADVMAPAVLRRGGGRSAGAEDDD